MKSTFVGFISLFLLVSGLFGWGCKSRYSAQKESSQTINTSGTPQDDGVSIVQAEYESWIAGVKGGGQGTEYFFTVSYTGATIPQFDSLFINNRGIYLFPGKAAAGNAAQTIQLRASDLNHPTPAMGAATTIYLSYRIAGKNQQLRIPTIKKRITPNRP